MEKKNQDYKACLIHIKWQHKREQTSTQLHRLSETQVKETGAAGLTINFISRRPGRISLVFN